MSNRYSTASSKAPTKKIVSRAKAQVKAAQRFKARSVVEKPCDPEPLQLDDCGCYYDDEIEHCNPTGPEINAALGGNGDEILEAVTTSCPIVADLTATSVDGPVAINGCQASQTRIWTITDACGDSIQHIQTVHWTQDTTGPVITLSTPDLVLFPDFPSGLPECDPLVDPACELSVCVNLGCGIPTEEQLEEALGTATAVDNCSCTQFDLIAEDGPVIGTECFSQTRYWEVADCCGNVATACRTVRWRSVTTIPPVITLDPVPQAVLNLYPNYPSDPDLGCNPFTGTRPSLDTILGTATASNSCGEIEFIEEDSPEEQNGCVRTVTRTWSAIDSCGNVADEQSRTASWIVDLVGPSIQCAPDLTIECGQTPVFTNPTVSADNCGGATPTPIVVNTVVNNVDGSRVETRTWTFTDACGNVNSCSQRITVKSCYRGCTKGFWQNNNGVPLWDQTTDAIVLRMPTGNSPVGQPWRFTTTVNNNFLIYFFGTNTARCGFAKTLTMLQALRLADGLGDCGNLARQGVAALLNSAAYGAAYVIPAPYNNLLTFQDIWLAIKTALNTCTSTSCKALAAALSIANERDPDSQYCRFLPNPTPLVQSGTKRVVRAAKKTIPTPVKQVTKKTFTCRNME